MDFAESIKGPFSLDSHSVKKDVTFQSSNTLDIEETLNLIPGLVDSDDEEEKDGGIELDEFGSWDNGK